MTNREALIVSRLIQATRQAADAIAYAHQHPDQINLSLVYAEQILRNAIKEVET